MKKGIRQQRQEKKKGLPKRQAELIAKQTEIRQGQKVARTLELHSIHCRICQHRDRESIEQWFIEWSSVTRLAKTYGLTPDSIYRHAHATGLFEKRQRNIRRALERIIEQVEDVQANAPAVVSAIQTYTKLNARGEWTQRPDGVGLREQFDRMNTEELETYAKDGKLPSWFVASDMASVETEGAEDGN